MVSPEYKQFLKYLLRHKGKAITITFMAFVQSALNILALFMVPQILFILNPSYKLSTKGLSGDFNVMGIILSKIIIFLESFEFFERIIYAVLIFSGLFMFKNIISYIQRITTSWLNLSVVNDIRQDVFAKIQKLPLSDFRKKETGHLLTLITVDVKKIMTSLKQVFDQMVTAPIHIFMMLYTIVAFSPKLSLAIIIFVPMIAFVIVKIGVVLKRRSEKAIKQNDRFMSVLSESFSGIKEIKAFNAEDYQYGRYLIEQNKLKILRFRRSLMSLLNMPLTEALSSVLIGGIIILGAYFIQTDPDFTAVAFASILIGITSIMEPMKNLGHIYNEFKIAMVSAARLFAVIDTDVSEQDIGSQDKDSFETKIEFNKVNFSYTDDAEFSLKDVSFTVSKGETVAIIGASGSGKSTIADLIGRFYKINSGDITIDDISINDIKLSSLRNLMTYVLQENFLFNDSVENNIRFNHPNATKEMVIDAAKVANAHNFIEDLDDGYDTIVGEKGSKLSGGQRQRIAIARAILKNTPIIVLDEATSALDSESEKVVQVAIENLKKDHTSIVIAHRLSTIINSDKIIVMDRGKIVEVGTHKDLIEKDGHYKKLFDIQFNN